MYIYIKRKKYIYIFLNYFLSPPPPFFITFSSQVESNKMCWLTVTRKLSYNIVGCLDMDKQQKQNKTSKYNQFPIHRTHFLYSLELMNSTWVSSTIYPSSLYISWLWHFFFPFFLYFYEKYEIIFVCFIIYHVFLLSTYNKQRACHLVFD